MNAVYVSDWDWVYQGIFYLRLVCFNLLG
jgi:hypothetical protein